MSKKGIHLHLVQYIGVLCTKFGWYWTIHVGLDSENVQNNYLCVGVIGRYYGNPN